MTSSSLFPDIARQSVMSLRYTGSSEQICEERGMGYAEYCDSVKRGGKRYVVTPFRHYAIPGMVIV